MSPKPSDDAQQAFLPDRQMSIRELNAGVTKKVELRGDGSVVGA
jgi:hypothetical protein